MKATNSWITYRTRFLVKAKPLTTNLTFTDPTDYTVTNSAGRSR